MKLLPHIITITLISSFSLSAQDTPEAQPEQAITFSDIKGQFPSAQNEGLGKIGSEAQIKVPEGMVFMNGKDGDKLLQSWGNLPSQIDALIMPTDASWCITFDFSDIGYVKDDEKEDIDADAILDEKKEAQSEANKQRSAQGLTELNIIKWVVAPNYNPSTNNLEWGMLLRDSDGSETINHETRLLGRRGVMNVTLLCAPEQFEDLKPALKASLAGFSYNDGSKYGEYQEGDKIAEYGLLGLMGAGGAFVIWKFWKPICAGLVAVGIAIKKFAGRLFGNKNEGRIS
ncbi:MAG: DUF2167 domain-containing protein [Akkermansiaceae bacterium]